MPISCVLISVLSLKQENMRSIFLKTLKSDIEMVALGICRFYFLRNLEYVDVERVFFFWSSSLMARNSPHKDE